MVRILKITSLLGAGFVAGVLGMRKTLKDGALVVDADGEVRAQTSPIEYVKKIKDKKG